jgi:hypothetical protein
LLIYSFVCFYSFVLHAEKRTEAKPVPATKLAPLAAAAGRGAAGVEATAHLFSVEPDSVDDVLINSFMQLQYAGGAGGRASRASGADGDGAAASDGGFVVVGECEAASAAAAESAAGPWSTDVGIGAKQIVTIEARGYTLLELNVNVEAGPGMFANTSLITVRPEHTIVNEMDGTIWIGQRRDAPAATASRRRRVETVSVSLFTVTFHANRAHNLTRSP